MLHGNVTPAHKKNWKVANLMCFLEIREGRSNLNIVYFAF